MLKKKSFIQLLHLPHPILSQSFVFLPPENIGKPMGSVMLLGDIEMIRWLKMSQFKVFATFMWN